MNKFNIYEIQRILEIEDKFTRVDLNHYDISTIEHLLNPFLEDCQNNSPELKDMIDLCKKYKGIMECYIVETNREDSRLSCEGIVFPKISTEDMIDIVNNYHCADEFNISTNADETFRVRLWWD